MQSPPLSVIAQWPKPNYVNPETRGLANVIIIATLLAFVAAVLGIRVYTRIRISKGFGLDDVLILCAFVPAMAFAIAGMDAEFRYQWNRHVWDIEPQLSTPGLQLSLATQVLFDVATSLTKLSMLALIYRLVAAGESRLARYIVMFMAVFVAAGSITFVLVTIFQCSPVSAYWTISSKPQKCINEEAHLLAAGIINTTTDFIITLLPIKTVMALNISFKQRAIVYSLFAGGFLASTAGAVRTYFTWVMTTSADFDVTWNAYLVVLTSSLELYIGIIVASLPATKPFFSRYVPRLLGTTGWTTVTEPLAERQKQHSKNAASASSFSFFDVESARFPLQDPPAMMASIIKSPSASSTWTAAPGLASPRGITTPTYPTTAVVHFAPLAQPLNLNKPLPHLSSHLERNALLEAILSRDSQAPRPHATTGLQGPPPLYGAEPHASVYDFKTYADGHISVHKTGPVPGSEDPRESSGSRNGYSWMPRI